MNNKDLQANNNAGRGIKIAKYIADAGIASRREAEAIVLDGRVKINSTAAYSPAMRVKETDRIEIDDITIYKTTKTRVWLYHKPVGLITTRKDPERRETIFDNLPPSLPRCLAVGRLDINSEGLLILTNNGELARELERPQNKFLRIYQVKASGKISAKKLDEANKGITVDGINYSPEYIKRLTDNNLYNWYEVKLREGKNREIRNIFTYLGLKIHRLKRISYAGFELDGIAKNKLEEVDSERVENFISMRGLNA
jgi:23S rRNA pseudouridine2605 synthase